jgi:hypothetical protein
MLQYALIALIGVKFSIVFFDKAGNDVISLIFSMAIIHAVMAIGVFAQGLTPKLRTLVGVGMAAGPVLQIILFFTKLTLPVRAYKIMLLYSVSSVVVTIWLILLFLAFDKETMALLKRKNNKRINIYSATEIVLVFAVVSMFHNFYHNSINALLVSGMTNRSDSLNAIQMMGLIDAKILRADVSQTIFLVCVGGLYLVLYRKWLLEKDNQSVHHSSAM